MYAFFTICFFNLQAFHWPQSKTNDMLHEMENSTESSDFELEDGQHFLFDSEQNEDLEENCEYNEIIYEMFI